MKNIVIILVILLVIAGIVYAFTESNDPMSDGDQIACTMDARACPDGSYVGRTGPNCEFAPCPTTGTSTINGTTSLEVNLQ